MNIIVVGCGKIGTSIISRLVNEGHDVTVIDSDSDVIAEITNIYDVMGVCGNGPDSEILSEAGVEKCNLFIAVTGSDELNMLSCFIARKMGALDTIARIRNPEYNDKSLGFIRQQMGLSMSVNPERLAAQEIFDILKFPSALKIESFSRRSFEMIEIQLKKDSALDGMKLIDFQNKYKTRVLVCAVQRNGEVFIPDGNFVIRAGDRIGLTAPRTENLKVLKALGIMQKESRSVMILGGSKTAFYLSKMLLNHGTSVKIIEKNRSLCREFCDAMPKAVVINGDGASQELFLEEGLAEQEAFVALTGMDEENILISMYAASQNVPKVISKINRSELIPMAEKLGLDCYVSPKDAVSDVVVRFARALQNTLGSNVERMYKLMDGKAEALEFNVKSDCRFLGVPLKTLQLKSNTIIGGIIRDRKAISPTGDDVFMAGDKVIVITTADRILRDFSDIIK